MVLDAIQRRLQNRITTHRRGAVVLHNLEHGRGRDITVFAGVANVDIPAGDFTECAQVRSVHVSVVERIARSPNPVGFQNLDGWNPGLRVVSQDAERVTVDNRPGHPHRLKLAEVIAPGKVATH